MELADGIYCTVIAFNNVDDSIHDDGKKPNDECADENNTA